MTDPIAAGTVTSVDIKPVGSPTVADAAVDDLVLFVNDASVFSPGDEVQVAITDGPTEYYTLAAVDDDEGLTLSTPLTDAAPAGTMVSTTPLQQKMVAQVRLVESGEVLPCTVIYRLQDALPLGIRDEATAETVVTLAIGDERYVFDVIAEQVVVDAGFIDPTTVTTDVAADWGVVVQQQLDDEASRVDADIAAIDQAHTDAEAAIDSRVDGVLAEFDDRPPRVESTSAPGSTANVAGTIWEQYDTLTPAAGQSRKLIAAWRGKGGTTWDPVSIDPVYIPKIDVNTGTVGLLGVSRLLVTDLTDYVRDPSMSGIGTWDPWPGAAYSTDTPYVSSPNGQHLRFTTANFTFTGGTAGRAMEPMFPVTPGDVFRCSMAYRRFSTTVQSAGYVALRMHYYDAAGNSIQADFTQIAMSAIGDRLWRTLTLDSTVPAGAAQARCYPYLYQTAAGGVYDVDEVHCRRKAGGELIVDGAVQARHFTGDTFKGVTMTAPLLQTSETDSRGIKLVSSANGAFGSLIAYAADGTPTFTLNGQTGDIVLAGSVTAGSTIEGFDIVGSSFKTETGFDDIEIIPGTSSLPAAINFLSDNAQYDPSQPARMSCYDSVQTIDGDTYDTVNVRVQGAKMLGSGTAPRIDIGSWKNRNGGAVSASLDYYAGGSAGSKGSHFFWIDANLIHNTDIKGFTVQAGRALGVGAAASLAPANGILTAGDISSGARVFANGQIQANYNNPANPGGGFVDGAFAGGGVSGASVNDNGRIVRTSSSLRYKKYVRELTLEEARVALTLRPVTFQWRADTENGNRRVPGFIAEEAHDAGACLWVTYTQDDQDAGEPDGFRYQELTAAHNALIQDHEARIAALEAENTELRDMVTALAERVAALETR
ncbi:MAG: tail fiber domain-containing protein [Hamadaea sp.]|nr:tail fiber domain-containing protein [Hamadaea sp.]